MTDASPDKLTTPLGLGVQGAAGRMGRQLLQAIAEQPDARLALAIDAPGQSCIGCDSSVLSGGSPSGVRVSELADVEPGDCATLIDFTAPPVTLQLIDRLLAGSPDTAAPPALVIGTTGFDPAQLEQLHSAAERLPIVFAANYSVGVTLALALLEQAASALGDDYDVEISEAHHRYKVDAPSGTALAMGRAIADVTGRDLATDAIYGRQGITGERDRRTIGFSTVRGGEIIGDHTVLFAGNGERLEITHRAIDRMTFARGAVRAALWVADRKPGLYDMKHVLDLA